MSTPLASSADPDPTAQVRELEAEVARLRRALESQSTSAPAAGKAPKTAREKRHWARNFWSVTLITIACLLAPLSVVSVWARGEVTDTDRYIATVAPLASDPAIQAAVSTRVTNAILEAIDVQALTAEAVTTITENRELNDRQTLALATLGGALDNGIESYIGSTVTKVVASEQFANLWTTANTELHSDLNTALTGQGTGAVQLENDQIVLNVGDVVAQVKERLISEGFTVAERIPTVNTTMVLYESNSLARIQTAYSLLNTIGFWLPLVAITLALIGVFLNTNARKALIGFGIGLTLAMVAAGAAYGIGRTVLLNELPPSSSAAAATALLDQVSYFLRQALWAGAAAGVVFILAGVFMGPSRFAVGVRGLADKGAGAVQGQLASWGATMEPARRFVASQATGLRIAASLIAVAFIFAQRYKTVSLVVWTTVALLVVLFIIQIFASDEGTADRADATGPPPAPQSA